jgi:hypothetical protein
MSKPEIAPNHTVGGDVETNVSSADEIQALFAPFRQYEMETLPVECFGLRHVIARRAVDLFPLHAVAQGALSQ